MTNDKRNWGRLIVFVCFLLVLGGCETTALLLPKKRVAPPVEVKEEPIVDEAILGSAATSEPKDVAHEDGELREETVVDARSASVEATAQEPVIVERTIVVGLPDPQYVAGRIIVYRGKIERWQVLEQNLSQLDIAMPQPARWQECRGLLLEIIDGYQGLATLQDSEFSDVDDQETPLSVSQRDIAYLESDCEAVFAAAASLTPDRLLGYKEIVADQADQVIGFWGEENAHDKVISSYKELVAATSPTELSLNSREYFAKALLATGKLRQAAEILLEVAEAKGELHGWPLRLQAAELLFAQGDYEKAQNEYITVADLLGDLKQAGLDVEKQLVLLGDHELHERELALYRGVLNGWLTFDGKKVSPDLVASMQRLEQDFPDSNYAQMARTLYERIGGSVQQFVGQQLEQARGLAAEKKFVQALDVLAALSQSAESEEALSLVREAEKEIKLLQAEEIEREKLLRKQALDAKWQEALLLYDQREYDAAIVAFEELVNSDYREQAKNKIHDAVNLAASEVRREAANLFVKSRKVEHAGQKGALLLESRRLLIMLQQKYPQADIISKVKQNQRSIEDEIRAVDPDLLEE